MKTLITYIGCFVVLLIAVLIPFLFGLFMAEDSDGWGTTTFGVLTGLEFLALLARLVTYIRT